MTDVPALPSVTADLAPTGTLRAVINLGNPVLSHGTPEDPGGVTVALARELAERLGVPVELTCVDAARKSATALTDGTADLAFLAVEPARADVVAFGPAYVVIEGVYAVAAGSELTSADEVDRPGTTIGVKEGSAYDLYLTRTLEHAEIVRGAEGTTVFTERGLDVAAGIRQPLSTFAADGAHRLLEPAFMQIQQAVAVPRDRSPQALAALSAFVTELVASGWVRTELERAGQDPDLVAALD